MAELLSFTLRRREVLAGRRGKAIPLRRRRALAHIATAFVHRAGALRVHSFKTRAALLEVRPFVEARTPVLRARIHAAFALLLKTRAVLRRLRTEISARAAALRPTFAHHFKKMLHLLRAWSSSEGRMTTLRACIHAVPALLRKAGAVLRRLRSAVPVMMPARALHSILLAVAAEILPLVVPVAVMPKATSVTLSLLLRRWWRSEISLRAVWPGVLSGAEKRTLPALPAPAFAAWGEVAAIAIRAFRILRALIFRRAITLLRSSSIWSFAAGCVGALCLTGFVAVAMLAMRPFPIGARCVFVVWLTFAGWRVRSLVVLCRERPCRKNERDGCDGCVVHFHSFVFIVACVGPHAGVLPYNSADVKKVSANFGKIVKSV